MYFRGIITFTLFYLFFGVRIAFAEFSFTSPTTNITPSEEIDTTVNLTLQGQGNKTYYLEGAFKKEGTTNYFGLTWNDTSWASYTSSNFTSLKSITTDQDGVWNGAVKVKLDESSSLYADSGTYILRLKRFTTGGSSSWADNDITLVVNAPATPTPTPTPSPTPAATPTPSATTQPFPTTKKTSTPTPSLKSSPTPSLNPSPTASAKLISTKSVIAGVTKTPTPSYSPSSSASAKVKVASEKQNNLFVYVGIAFIIFGISFSLYLIFKKRHETI